MINILDYRVLLFLLLIPGLFHLSSLRNFRSQILLTLNIVFIGLAYYLFPGVAEKLIFLDIVTWIGLHILITKVSLLLTSPIKTKINYSWILLSFSWLIYSQKHMWNALPYKHTDFLPFILSSVTYTYIFFRQMILSISVAQEEVKEL